MRKERKMISVDMETYQKLDFIKILSQQGSWNTFFSNFVVPTLGKEIANGAVDRLIAEHQGNLESVKADIVARFGGNKK